MTNYNQAKRIPNEIRFFKYGVLWALLQALPKVMTEGARTISTI